MKKSKSNLLSCWLCWKNDITIILKFKLELSGILKNSYNNVHHILEKLQNKLTSNIRTNQQFGAITGIAVR